MINQPLRSVGSTYSDRPFIIVGITLEKSYQNESSDIEEVLLSQRADYVHLRHPEATREEMKKLIESINPSLHSRLTLHDHFELIKDFHIGGIHLNSRNHEIPEYAWNKGKIRISRSCHSLEEIALFGPELDYVTLSPIFDSISKQGYSSAFHPDTYPQLMEFLASCPAYVVALGGVRESHLHDLETLGFSGAAMSGSMFGSAKNIR